MKYKTYSKQSVGAVLIEEALALLRIIETEQSNEDINEGPQARELRFMLRATTRQLVTKVIEELRASDREEPQVSFFAKAA